MAISCYSRSFKSYSGCKQSQTTVPTTTANPWKMASALNCSLDTWTDLTWPGSGMGLCVLSARLLTSRWTTYVNGSSTTLLLLLLTDGLDSHACQYSASECEPNSAEQNRFHPALAKTLFIQLKIESHCLRTSPEHSLGNWRIGWGLICGGGIKPLKELVGVCSNTSTHWFTFFLSFFLKYVLQMFFFL